MPYRNGQASGSSICTQANQKTKYPFIPVNILSIANYDANFLSIPLSTYGVYLCVRERKRERRRRRWWKNVCVLWWKIGLKWIVWFYVLSQSLGRSIDYNVHISEMISNLNIIQNNGKIMRFVVFVWFVLLGWYLDSCCCFLCVVDLRVFLSSSLEFDFSSYLFSIFSTFDVVNYSLCALFYFFLFFSAIISSAEYGELRSNVSISFWK